MKSSMPRNGGKGKGKRQRRWLFTVNNPTEQETSQYVSTQLAQGKGFRYLVFQLEQGEEGTTHYQGNNTYNYGTHLQAMLSSITLLVQLLAPSSLPELIGSPQVVRLITIATTALSLSLAVLVLIVDHNPSVCKARGNTARRARTPKATQSGSMSSDSETPSGQASDSVTSSRTTNSRSPSPSIQDSLTSVTSSSPPIERALRK